MKHTIYLYLLLSGILHAGSIRQQSAVNDEVYVANVTTDMLSKHSKSPKEQSLVEDVKVFQRIALKYIETHFNAKIDLAEIPAPHRSLEFNSISEGGSDYYYAVYSIGVKRSDGNYNYYRIPIALDYTVIPPKQFNKKSG